MTTGLVGAFSAFSPDGLHWTPHLDEPNWKHHLDPDRMIGFGDTFWTPGWDQHYGCYVCYCRVPQKTQPYLRAIGIISATITSTGRSRASPRLSGNKRS